MSMSKKNTITSILESASQSGALSPAGSSLTGVASVGNSQALKTPSVMSFSRSKPSSPAAPVKEQPLSTKSRQVTQADMDSVSANLFPASPTGVPMNTSQSPEVVRNPFSKQSSLPPSSPAQLPSFQSISPVFPVSGSSFVNMSSSPAFPSSPAQLPSSQPISPVFPVPGSSSVNMSSSPAFPSSPAFSQSMSSPPAMTRSIQQPAPLGEQEIRETVSQQPSRTQSLNERMSQMRNLTSGQTISSDAAQKLSMLRSRSSQSMGKQSMSQPISVKKGMSSEQTSSPLFVGASSQSPPKGSSPVSESTLKSNIMSNLDSSNKPVSLSERLQQSRQMSMRPSAAKSPDSFSKKSLSEKISEIRLSKSQEMSKQKSQEESQQSVKGPMSFSQMQSQLKSTESSSKKSLAEKVSELRQMSQTRSSLSEEKKEVEKIQAEAAKLGIAGFENPRSRSTSPVKSYRSSMMSRRENEDVVPTNSQAPLSFKSVASSIKETESLSKSKLREQVAKLKEANANLYSSKMSEEPKSVHSSMSLKPMSPSKTVDYALKVNDVTAVETGEEKPKIGDDEPMAKHRRLFNDLGITFVKMFTDAENETVYMHGVNKNGGHIVVEDRNHAGTSLYLSDGHIIEQHTGEELNLSKRIIEKECEALGTCGMFSHDGSEIVVSKKTNGKIHKVQYLISSAVNERSIIEAHGVVTIPVVQFQDLENPDRKYVDALLETADAKFVEYNKRAMDDVETRMSRVAQMTLALEATEGKFIKNVSIGISNFKIALKTLSENFEYYTKAGDSKMLEKCSIARKELFDDIQEFIIESHKIEKMIEHAMTVKDAIEQRNKALVSKLSKYSV